MEARAREAQGSAVTVAERVDARSILTQTDFNAVFTIQSVFLFVYDTRATTRVGAGAGQPAWRLSARLGTVGIGTDTGQRIATGRMVGIGTGRRIATGRMIGNRIGTVSRIATGRMRSPDCRPPDRQGRRHDLPPDSPGVPTTTRTKANPPAN